MQFVTGLPKLNLLLLEVWNKLWNSPHRESDQFISVCHMILMLFLEVQGCSFIVGCHPVLKIRSMAAGGGPWPWWIWPRIVNQVIGLKQTPSRKGFFLITRQGGGSISFTYLSSIYIYIVQ